MGSISRQFRHLEDVTKKGQINLEVSVISFERTCILRSFSIAYANCPPIQNESYLFSEEQKNETQGLMLFLSEDGGRYIASEKQVSSSFSSSILTEQTWISSQL